MSRLEFRTELGSLKIYGAKRDGTKLYVPVIFDFLPLEMLKKKIKKAIMKSPKIEFVFSLKQYAILSMQSPIKGKASLSHVLSFQETSKKVEYVPAESIIFDVEFTNFVGVPNLLFYADSFERPSRFIPLYPLEYVKIRSIISIQIILPESLGKIYHIDKDLFIPYRFGRSETLFFTKSIKKLLDLWDFEIKGENTLIKEKVSKSIIQLAFNNPIKVKEGDFSTKIIPVNMLVENNEDKDLPIKLITSFCYRVASYGKAIKEILRPPLDMKVLASGLRIIKALEYNILLKGKRSDVKIRSKDVENPLIFHFGESDGKLYFPILITPQTWEFLKVFSYSDDKLSIVGYPCFRFLILSKDIRKSLEIPLIFETV